MSSDDKNNEGVMLVFTMVASLSIAFIFSSFLFFEVGDPAETSASIIEYDDRVVVNFSDIDSTYPHAYIANNSKSDEGRRDVIYLGNISDGVTKYTLYEEEYPGFVHSEKYQVIVSESKGDLENVDSDMIADKNSFMGIGYIDKRG